MSYYSRDEDRDFKVLIRALIGAAIAAIAFSFFTSCKTIDKLPNIDVCKIAPEKFPETCPQPSPSPTAGPIITPTPLPTAEPSPEPTATPGPEEIFGSNDVFPAIIKGGTKKDNPSLEPIPQFAQAIEFAIDFATGRAPNGTVIEDPRLFYIAVKESLRARDFFVDYDNRGDDRYDSEISIWRGCHLESYQILTSAKKLRRLPGSFMGYGDIPCTHNCSLQHPLKNGYEIRLQVGKHGQGLEWDGTPILYNPDPSRIPPPAWTGNCQLARQCFIGAEKDGESGAACTVDLCGAKLHYEVIEGNANINRVEGYTAKITPGPGGALIRASCDVDPNIRTIFPVGR